MERAESPFAESLFFHNNNRGNLIMKWLSVLLAVLSVGHAYFGFVRSSPVNWLEAFVLLAMAVCVLMVRPSPAEIK